MDSWNRLEQSGLTYSVMPTRDKSKLKLQLIDIWCGLKQSIFDEAVDQW